ncbi:hypothetical protein PR202_ga10935 [Eleusine coracana subsp. coracana]|uniref:WAT1-related protein n=1 Tax=Eleusine coracana subsp. coracana TaxID=191504 RepID=A0AAV5C8A2_ELECO|nr:hypothetical protein PR202_ga10935 [Eleusine coracana subsp. coracana]
MEAKKPYVIAVVIQLIYAGMFVVSKAAFDHGLNTFVFIFYRMAAACLLLLPIALVFERNTFSLNLYNVSMKFTSATVASASSNSMPVVAFCLAVLLRLEVVKLRSSSGIAKLTGVALCLAGVFVLAFYTGPPVNPVNHHRAFAATHTSNSSPSRMTWIKGTFLMVLANVTWAIWIVLQAALLKEYPNKMLVTVTQCVFSMAQSFVVAVVAERDFSRWKIQLDISLLAIVYTMKGPVFLAIWNPLCFVITIFCSSFFLCEIVHLGSILGGGLLVCGLYSVLWGKSKDTETMSPGDELNTVYVSQDELKKRQENESMGTQEESTVTSKVEQV